MNDKQIADAIADLRAQIDDLEPGDAASAERLRNLVERLEVQLEGSGVIQHQSHLVDDVRDAITEFEVEHPRMTGILNDIMVALGNLGI